MRDIDAVSDVDGVVDAVRDDNGVSVGELEGVSERDDDGLSVWELDGVPE